MQAAIDVWSDLATSLLSDILRLRLPSAPNPSSFERFTCWRVFIFCSLGISNLSSLSAGRPVSADYLFRTNMTFILSLSSLIYYACFESGGALRSFGVFRKRWWDTFYRAWSTTNFPNSPPLSSCESSRIGRSIQILPCMHMSSLLCASWKALLRSKSGEKKRMCHLNLIHEGFSHGALLENSMDCYLSNLFRFRIGCSNNIQISCSTHLRYTWRRHSHHLQDVGSCVVNTRRANKLGSDYFAEHQPRPLLTHSQIATTKLERDAHTQTES